MESIAYDLEIPNDIDLDRIEALVSKWGDFIRHSNGSRYSPALATAVVWTTHRSAFENTMKYEGISFEEIG